MKNPTLFYHMITRYTEFSATPYFIFGFIYKQNVYAVRANRNILPLILKLDKASRGAGYSLRFCPTAAQKVFLLSQGAEWICSKQSLLSLVKNSPYNRGEIFEKLLFQKNKQPWRKTSSPFYHSGDLVIGNIDYQIKFERATFLNERSLRRLEN